MVLIAGEIAIPRPRLVGGRGNDKERSPDEIGATTKNLEVLDIEQEGDYISILDDVIFTFCS